MKMVEFLFKFRRSPIDNKQALVQVMDWRRTGDKQLPEAMVARFSEAYMRH